MSSPTARAAATSACPTICPPNSRRVTGTQ